MLNTIFSYTFPTQLSRNTVATLLLFQVRESFCFYPKRLQSFVRRQEITSAVALRSFGIAPDAFEVSRPMKYQGLKEFQELLLQ